MSTRIKPKEVFVVVPAFNENAVIRQVVSDLLGFQYQVVVIDDGSETSLYALLNDLPVYFLRHEINLGQGAALQTGIEFALTKDGNYIVTFDADGQHRATDIERLIQPLADNEANFVLGSRFIEGASHNMPWRRKILLQLVSYLNYFFTGLLLTDAYNGLRAMTRPVAEKIHLVENGMAHSTEFLAQIKKNKFRYKEIAVNINYTEYSLKKGLTLWSGFRILIDIFLNKIFK